MCARESPWLPVMIGSGAAPDALPPNGRFLPKPYKLGDLPDRCGSDRGSLRRKLRPGLHDNAGADRSVRARAQSPSDTRSAPSSSAHLAAGSRCAARAITTASCATLAASGSPAPIAG